MTGAEFVRAIRKLGRRRGLAVRFVTRRGKGSHGTLYLGERKTIVKDRKKELSRGLLADMLRQLGLDPRDLEE
ncbi:MAG: type II toxin-antitoxin system HicA family toxin [Geminicoccaceae bacterium]